MRLKFLFPEMPVQRIGQCGHATRALIWAAVLLGRGFLCGDSAFSYPLPQQVARKAVNAGRVGRPALRAELSRAHKVVFGFGVWARANTEVKRVVKDSGRDSAQSVSKR